MSLKFAYRGTEYPTQEMIDWFDYSFNKEPENNDELESDMWYSENQQSFFDDFSDDLRELSYMEMLDVYKKSRDASF
tara:strand:+ start:81 stop:311 length:231 start_codon:yes stop_codon:yes gene_type:complete